MSALSSIIFIAPRRGFRESRPNKDRARPDFCSIIQEAPCFLGIYAARWGPGVFHRRPSQVEARHQRALRRGDLSNWLESLRTAFIQEN